MKTTTLALAAAMAAGFCLASFATPPVPSNVAFWGAGSVPGEVPADMYPVVQLDGGSGHRFTGSGGGHFVALRADGRVFAWGNNGSGQCNVPDGLTDVVQIAAGGRHSAALKSDGTLVLWGGNEFGQCDASFDLEPVVSVRLGSAITIVETISGELQCWGYNSFGECSMESVPPDPASFSAGGRHSLFLRADGTVVCLGAFCSVPGSLDTVVAIDAGYDHGLALRSDGTVVCVSGGCCGVCDIPLGLTDAVAVAAGGSVSAAVRANGDVVVWGTPAIPTPPPGLMAAIGIACSDGAIAVIEQRDCNDNGVDDFTEIAATPALDCNRNGIPDECESVQRLRTRATFPFGNGHPHVKSFTDLPVASGDVEITVRTVADLAGVSKFLTLRLNGVAIATLFAIDGSPCGSGEQTATVTLSGAEFNSIVSDGAAQFRIEPSGSVAPASCEVTWATVTVRYPISPDRPDCDGNGAWDACDISAGGAADCNGNWIPDQCESELIDCDADGVLDVCQIAADPSVDTNGDGILDACQYARGDFTLDGQVDGADLSLLLLLWGAVNPKIGDLTGDGQINGSDLGYLLLNWGPVSF